jgi:UDP-2,4-diacetamido-2,4,6-trideoxy-beta-L-altropyranose hydrolase
MRGLGLAQAWRTYANGPTVFCCAQLPAALERRIESEGFDLVSVPEEHDARVTLDSAKRLGVVWTVVDGYHFEETYAKMLSDGGQKVFAADDDGQGHIGAASIVWNQNVHANRENYAQKCPHARLLLGCRYVVLRNEFRPFIGASRTARETASRVLVTLGGSDPDNVTKKVIDALVDEPRFDVIVVAGGGNPHLAALREATDWANGQIRLVCDVQDMSELIQWADIGIVAGGSTSWEFLFLGLPSITLILAPNQRPIADALAAADLTETLGIGVSVSAHAIATAVRELSDNLELRQKRTRAGQSLVDGRGSERVVNALFGETLELRPVADRDCRQVWLWANDTNARRVSFSSEPIPWSEHEAWFADRLTDSSFLGWIASNRKGETVGFVRFERNEDDAIISVLIDAAHRGVGYGERLITLGAQRCFAQWSVASVVAFIKLGNGASLKVFTNAGFRTAGDSTVGGQNAIKFVLRAEMLNA